MCPLDTSLGFNKLEIGIKDYNTELQIMEEKKGGDIKQGLQKL